MRSVTRSGWSRSENLRWSPLWIAILALLLVAACAPARQLVYSPEEIREEIRERAGGNSTPIVVPYDLSPQLEELARQRVAERRPGQPPIEALIDTVFDVEHDYAVTGTADEVFAAGRGDCISATSLFIGLSRAAGLSTYFVEAMGVEEVSAHETLNVYHRHVLAGYGPAASATLIDFGRVDNDYVHFRVLTDVEAIARFYNTRGYQALRRGELEQALEAFDTAVTLAPKLAWSHNNRAVALRRLGELEQAEASLRRSLEADRDYAGAHANLAILLELTGRHEDAERHRRRALELRRGDPLMAFQQARERIRAGDFAAAVDPLEKAVRRSPRFVAAWRELGRVYVELDNERRALKAIRRLLDITPGDRSGLLMLGVLEGKISLGEFRDTWPAEKIRKPRVPAVNARAPRATR